MSSQALGQASQALAAYRSALTIVPDHPEYLNRLARLLTTEGNLADALPVWERLAASLHGDVEVTAALASILIEQGQATKALQHLSEAARQRPDNAALAHLTGQALLKLDMPGPATGAFYHALTLNPDIPAYHASLAAALLAEGHLSEGLAHAWQAFQAAPIATHAATLSCALLEQGLLSEALAVTDLAAEAGQASAEVLVNRSIALEGLGQAEHAITSARAAVSMQPTATVEHHLAALLLAYGQLTAEAWRLYESRLRLPTARNLPGDLRRWNGQDVQGKTVLLHAEQGLGDTLQFIRYVPLVAARGATVVVVVQPSLRRLLEGMPGASRLLACGESLPAFDLFSPLLSLPGIFATALTTIPPALPYRLTHMPRPAGPLRVGLVWAGNSDFIEDRKRSLPPELLSELMLPGVDLFSLQLQPRFLPDGVTDLMSGVTDMADTALKIAGLDLVIAVDTAVAHLAATMGKPVWLLSRFRGCWRWLEGRTDSPWYSSLTIYRQPRPGDWAAVLKRIRTDLECLASTTPSHRHHAD